MDAMSETSGTKKTASRRKGAPEAAVLDPTMIVQATLDLINQEGLDAFSLRSLAKRLGVFPTAIYWHVPSRNELLSRAVALALENVVPSRRNPDWRAQLRNVLSRIRKAIQRNPNIAPLVGPQMVTNAHTSLRMVEEILHVLDQANCRGINMVAGFNFIIASIVGFTTQEFAPLPESDAGEWQEQIKDRLNSVDKKRFPTLAANVDDLATRAFIVRYQSGVEHPLDETFDLFLTAVIGGVERLAGTGAP